MEIKIPLNDSSYYFSEDPKKDLMDKLVTYTLKAEHQLSFDEASKIPEMYKPNYYAFYYGSFQEAARIAWKKAREINVPNTTSPVLQEETFNPKATQNTEPELESSIPSPKRRKAGRKQHFTAETIIASIIEFYKANGRLPSQYDMMVDPEMPSWPTILKYIGPKSEWENHFELPPLEATPPAKESPSLLNQQVLSMEGSAPPAEKPSDPPAEKVKIEASHRKEVDVYVIKLKITLPNRKNPVLVTLTI